MEFFDKKEIFLFYSNKDQMNSHIFLRAREEFYTVPKQFIQDVSGSKE